MGTPTGPAYHQWELPKATWPNKDLPRYSPKIQSSRRWQESRPSTASIDDRGRPSQSTNHPVGIYGWHSSQRVTQAEGRWRGAAHHCSVPRGRRRRSGRSTRLKAQVRCLVRSFRVHGEGGCWRRGSASGRASFVRIGSERGGWRIRPEQPRRTKKWSADCPLS